MRDIEKGLKKYPSLYLDTSQKIPIVRGTFVARDKKGKIEIETYDVLIRFPGDYPNVFPLVEEISRKIPRELARHVKGDGTLCFGNWQDEFSACQNGITFTWFLEEILNTHLCREYVREKTGSYPTGERSHGIEGIWEGYYDMFGMTDKAAVLKELTLILSHRHVGRNAYCYCGNGKKYKSCHGKIEEEVLKSGRSNVIRIFDLLKKDYKIRNENI